MNLRCLLGNPHLPPVPLVGTGLRAERAGCRSMALREAESPGRLDGKSPILEEIASLRSQ